MDKVLKLLYDNLKLIIMALISIVTVVIITIILSLSLSEDIARQPVISEINGEGSILRDNGVIMADKRMKIKSGDIIKTGEDSYIRLSVDDDKLIVVEENSEVLVYFTEVAGKGSIEVNVTNGSALCGIEKPLRKKSYFKIKTPNSVTDVKGTVIRTSFKYADKYMGYEDVYITEVQNFSGKAEIQLYDIDAKAQDQPMLLIERASAKMITCGEISAYEYLNHDTDMYGIPEHPLVELLRISIESHKLAYNTDELNTAYKAVQRINKAVGGTDAFTLQTLESMDTASEKTTRPPVTAPVFPADIDPGTASPPGETYGTLATTLKTHVYTTYPGEKWWEITNNGSTQSVYDEITETDEYNEYSNFDEWYDQLTIDN